MLVPKLTSAQLTPCIIVILVRRMMLDPDKPLSPANATVFLRQKHGPHLDLNWTHHAKVQMSDRGLLMGDVLHLIKHGFVHEEGTPATQKGFFKYQMECTTPNSGGRAVCAVVIPSAGCALKVVTVMWKDEAKIRG